jgi:hypothetical protein
VIEGGDTALVISETFSVCREERLTSTITQRATYVSEKAQLDNGSAIRY